ncbi:MAG: aspartate ammonia-lyase [Clostridiaceae bacterium]|nr:aspartate ammonia-lyase [Clostridiaceae bacterium]
MKNTRIESDSIGSMDIPIEAYYGVQSLRAKNNFPITNKRMNKDFIISLAEIKKAAAITNKNEGKLSNDIANAIIQACDEIIKGNFLEEFIVDPIQGGAGTSANMNANEVIANRAIEILGGEKGDYELIHPNDHVNMCQSTNDVFPTAGKLTILKLMPKAINQLDRLFNALKLKSIEFQDILKLGRTQLQDAVPMTLGQSFNAYATAIKRNIVRLNKAKRELEIINLGATAIGSSINATPYYVENITSNLSKITKIPLYQATDLFDATENLDTYVAVSGALKSCAVTISKIANDLRLLSSGPRAGLSEIILPAKQNGSSIMPGKINPVIPEVVSQVAFNIIGNDFTITMAAESGQLELNAFEPILFYNIFESIETLENVVKTFVDNCIIGIKANKDRCLELLNFSVATATALCPYIGYKKAAEIAKKALKENTTIKDIVLNENLINKNKLEDILNPATLTELAPQSEKFAI